MSFFRFFYGFLGILRDFLRISKDFFDSFLDFKASK